VVRAAPQAAANQHKLPVVLSISPFEQDHAILRRLLRQHGWELYATDSIDCASNLIRLKHAAVVITEKDLSVGGWRDVLKSVSLLPHSPLIVVSSLQADDHLWAEALNLGVYDVLAKPLDPTEVIRVLNSAWVRYKSCTEIPG
jgi:DNA-binding NtrC family response regulator